ncbi:hypothetical protein HORIV_20250 [Vreelandella olivaria]|uniref:Uncharacterized protein n=1 Tax=Vreelandella olivaria TaxID=390919 RepID=A0ABN5WRM4_9GAMM|nr:hypothetical protein HORIV_20250 [Halomonas olivaria]
MRPTIKSCALALYRVQREGRERLGELFAEAEFQEDPSADDETLNAARKTAAGADDYRRDR